MWKIYIRCDSWGGGGKCKGRKRWLSPDRWVLQVGVSEFLSSEMRFCKGSKRPCHRNLVRACGTRAEEGVENWKSRDGRRKDGEKSPATLAGAGKFVLLSRGPDKFLQSQVFYGRPRETRPSRDDQRFLDKVKYWRVLRGDATTSRNANIKKKEALLLIHIGWFPFSRISSCKHFPIIGTSIVGTSRILDSKVFFWSSTYRLFEWN